MSTTFRHNTIFKDVYREVGILEVFVTCLHRYATLLKDKQAAIDQGSGKLDSSSISRGHLFVRMKQIKCLLRVILEYEICPEDEQLGVSIMEALTTLLAGNVQNANVFRECGGARCAHNLVPYVDCRERALGIVKELILCAGGDDDMATLLGVMHSAPPNALILKTHILKVSFSLSLSLSRSPLYMYIRYYTITFAVFANLSTRVAQD